MIIKEYDEKNLAKDMYREEILNHFKNPRNSGTLNGATIHHEEFNPLCGDEIHLDIIIKSNKIKDIKFKGNGCAISQASISMLTEKLKGKNIDEVKKLKDEEVIEMLNIPIGPVRMKCALLSLVCIKNAIKKHEGKK